MFEALEPGNAAGENSWHHMINYWLDHDKNLTEALTLAQREYDVRKDVFTCDTLAWAFFKNGRLSEANALMKEALRLGTRDARIFYHAGTIYDGLGDRRNAAKYLALALEISPVFDVRQTTKARLLLETLQIRPAPKT
jgi:tetratricopeptide (TPR) repeat protein